MSLAAWKELDQFLAAHPAPGEWVARAACAGCDQSYFFTAGTGAGHLRARKALAICAGCEVRDDCLSYALSVPELKGIWGGMGERRRKELRSRLRDEQREPA